MNSVLEPATPAALVNVKSFARIHETNLKKQACFR
jgi:aconitase A